MKSTKGQALRFLVAGCVNTGLTYLIYLISLDVVGYTVAFSFSFVIGIVIAFVIYSRFVFRSPIVWRKLMHYPMLYSAQYAVGLVLLTVLIEVFEFDERMAPLVNIAILTPVAFLLNRWFLLRGK